MRQITVTYHHEDGAWWAEAPSVPGFSAAAASFEELRAETREGIAFAVDDEPFLLLETTPGGPWQSEPPHGSHAPHLSEPEVVIELGYDGWRRPFGGSRNGRLALT